jgi:hypothetical protein
MNYLCSSGASNRHSLELVLLVDRQTPCRIIDAAPGALPRTFLTHLNIFYIFGLVAVVPVFESWRLTYENMESK